MPHWHIGQYPNPELVILSLHFPALPSVVPSIKLCALCVALIFVLSDVAPRSVYIQFPLKVPSLPSLPGELQLLLSYLVQGHFFLVLPMPSLP